MLCFEQKVRPCVLQSPFHPKLFPVSVCSLIGIDHQVRHSWGGADKIYMADRGGPSFLKSDANNNPKEGYPNTLNLGRSSKHLQDTFFCNKTRKKPSIGMSYFACIWLVAHVNSICNLILQTTDEMLIYAIKSVGLIRLITRLLFFFSTNIWYIFIP